MIGPSGFFVDMKDSQCPIMPDELEMLHESGYGICLLYKARKEGRIFICKALRPEYRGLPVYEEMMKKDFAIGSSLHHPNICRYYAYATTPDLGNCILMEWVDGINLQQYIETNRCSVGKTKEKDRIVCEICAALEHMHRRQVVHRDLKPSNIMLTTNGMHAKIVDFGLSDSDSFAFMKIPAGTRLYASPELMAGERVDGRSDLWSLGVILREFGSSYFRISAKCMRRNPSERYDSAWEVMQDVLSPSRSIRKKIMVAAAMVCSTFIGVYAGAVLKDIIFESDESDSPAYDMRGLARPELLSGATLKVEEPLPEPFPVMMLPATQHCADPPHEVPQEPSRPATATDDTPAAAAWDENVMDSSDLEDLFRIAVEAIRK